MQGGAPRGQLVLTWEGRALRGSLAEISLHTSIRGDCLGIEGRGAAAGYSRPAKHGMCSDAAAQGGVGRGFKTEKQKSSLWRRQPRCSGVHLAEAL